MPPDALVSTVRAKGIDTVIDFRDDEPEAVAAEEAAMEEAGIHYVHYPSPQVPSKEQIQGFLEALRGELDAGHEVLLHCHHGEGRAPLYGALYRIEFEGWEPADALDSIVRLPPRLLFLQRIFPGLGRLSATNPKRELLLNYERVSDAPPPGS